MKCNVIHTLPSHTCVPMFRFAASTHLVAARLVAMLPAPSPAVGRPDATLLAVSPNIRAQLAVEVPAGTLFHEVLGFENCWITVGQRLLGQGYDIIVIKSLAPRSHLQSVIHQAGGTVACVCQTLNGRHGMAYHLAALVPG